ncbi:hypothetical protein GCM10010349_33240 [Streptomyces flavofungini]|nr:hypothetical protein GCM10010349_33240 [Streptomyces flavofungini]
MAAVATKRVDLVCGWCGEPWTYDRPRGKRGRNPVTNPEHSMCGTKRQNQNRARGRERAAKGEQYEPWNIPPVDSEEGLTEEEVSIRDEALERPWWRTPHSSSQRAEVELSIAQGAHYWDDYRAPAEDDHAYIEYSTHEDKREVARWISRERAPRTATSNGRTSKKRLPVIGSPRPWAEAAKPRETAPCVRAPGPLLEPFVRTF